METIDWARLAWPPVVVGMVLISMASWISETVRHRWFALPEIIALSAIPVATAAALYAVRMLLAGTLVRGALCWLPFALMIGVFLCKTGELKYA